MNGKKGEAPCLGGPGTGITVGEKALLLLKHSISINSSATHRRDAWSRTCRVLNVMHDWKYSAWLKIHWITENMAIYCMIENVVHDWKYCVTN
jgi:hypothetical protein